MSSLVDTLLNLFVFAFVGLLFWLYFKETPSDGSTGGDDAGDQF